MPLDGGLLSLAGQGLNAITGIFQGNQQFGRDIAMYHLQRAHALKDWHMMNDYNSPAQQMKRLKEAGWNPFYGNGQGNVAQPIRATQADTTPMPRINFDAAGAYQSHIAGLLAGQDLEVKKETANNLREQNTVLQNEALLKKAQVVSTLSAAEKTNLDRLAAEFALDLQKELRSTSVDAAKLDVQKKIADTQFTIDSNERAMAQNAASLKEAAERILTSRVQRATSEAQREEIRARIKNMATDNTLRELELQLRRQGVNPNDPIWWRTLNGVLNDSTWKQTPGSVDYYQQSIKGTRPKALPKRRR